MRKLYFTTFDKWQLFYRYNGGGLILKAGDVITETQTIYIYAVGAECYKRA